MTNNYRPNMDLLVEDTIRTMRSMMAEYTKQKAMSREINDFFNSVKNLFFETRAYIDKNKPLDLGNYGDMGNAEGEADV